MTEKPGITEELFLDGKNLSRHADLNFFGWKMILRQKGLILRSFYSNSNTLTSSAILLLDMPIINDFEILKNFVFLPRNTGQ